MTERLSYEGALRRTDMLSILAPFDPHVVGTLPLGIARPNSDIDILCCAVDRSEITTLLWEHFHDANGFAIHQWSAKGRPLIARFEAHRWPFEVERRLLDLGGPALRTAILALRAAGKKTEPAFATLLGLPGDLYRAVSELFGLSDDGLIELLIENGFVSRSGVIKP